MRFDEVTLQDPAIGTLRYLKDDWASRVTLRKIGRSAIDGLDAVAASTPVETSSGVRDVRLIAIRAAPQRIYRFFFVTPPDRTQAFAAPFQQTMASFRRLSQRQTDNLRPLRLRVVEVAAGDTVESLSARMPFNDFRTERFLVLNGLQPGERLRSGQLVKIVTE